VCLPRLSFFPRNNYCTCPSYRQIDVSPFRTPTVLTAHRYRGSPLADWFHTWSYFPLSKNLVQIEEKKGGTLCYIYVSLEGGKKSGDFVCAKEDEGEHSGADGWFISCPSFLFWLWREMGRRRTPSYPLTCSVFQWTDSLNRKRKKKYNCG